MPTISIIIPVFNTEKYLDECLNSICNQSFKDIEIICVNDASTDASLEILKKWAELDHRIIIIDSKVNLRQGGARNLGIRKSKGIYLGFVDSDDYISSNMYEDLLNSSDNMKADIVIGRCYNSYHNGIIKVLENLPIQKLTIEEIKKHILIYGCRMVTNIIKKELILINDLFYPEGVIYEDNANGPCLFLCAKTIEICNHSSYFYRTNDNSTTHLINDYRFFDRLITAELFFKNTKRLNYYNKYEKEIDYLFYKLYVHNSILGSLTMFSVYPLSKVRFIIKSSSEIRRKINMNPYYIQQKKLRMFIVHTLCLLPILGIPISLLFHSLKRLSIIVLENHHKSQIIK